MSMGKKPAWMENTADQYVANVESSKVFGKVQESQSQGRIPANAKIDKDESPICPVLSHSSMEIFNKYKTCN